jgi:hypothetical protein
MQTVFRRKITNDIHAVRHANVHRDKVKNLSVSQKKFLQKQRGILTTKSAYLVFDGTLRKAFVYPE